MSANSATIAFRVKPEIKRRADALFERLGMTTSTGMNILLMQTLNNHGFVAPIVVPDDDTPAADAPAVAEPAEEYDTPNARVRATLERVLAGTEPLYGPFDSTEEMLKAALAMKD